MSLQEEEGVLKKKLEKTGKKEGEELMKNLINLFLSTRKKQQKTTKKKNNNNNN